MFENLKIRNRLGKAFRIIVTTCSIAAVLGVVMLIVTMTLYKNALNNYGFSQGDIGKALVAFTDTRSATRAIVGYDDDSLISQMSDTHDERKATFEQYWEIVDEVTTTSKEQEIYDSIDAKLEELQQELLKRANARQDYEYLADEIDHLRERKQKVMADNAERDGTKQRIAEMQQFLAGQTEQIEEYDENLVRRMVEKITVYEEKFMVEFKSGTSVNVER